MSEIVNQSLQKIAKAFVGKWVKSIKMRNFHVYNRSPITHHRLRITDYRLRITDHALPITDHALRITDHASRDMSHMKDKTVSVVGLGYVGLPLAKAF